VNGVVVDLMFVLNALAQQCGLARALGTSRLAALTLFLVLARVAHQSLELVKKLRKPFFTRRVRGNLTTGTGATTYTKFFTTIVRTVFEEVGLAW